MVRVTIRTARVFLLMQAWMPLPDPWALAGAAPAIKKIIIPTHARRRTILVIDLCFSI